MVLKPRPARRKPSGCSVLPVLLVLPLAGAAYAATAPMALDLLKVAYRLAVPLAFNLMEVLYWGALMAAALVGLLAIRGKGQGNLAAWPLVLSAYVAAALDWQAVEFSPRLWRLIDLAAVAGIVGLRLWERVLPRRSDYGVFALMLAAWLLYDLPSYEAYVGIIFLVIVQCALVVVDGLGERVQSPAKAPARSE